MLQHTGTVKQDRTSTNRQTEQISAMTTDCYLLLLLSWAANQLMATFMCKNVRGRLRTSNCCAAGEAMLVLIYY